VGRRTRIGHRAQACPALLPGPAARSAGPLAPPPRCAHLRSRWRSRYGGANAGRLARKTEAPSGRRRPEVPKAAADLQGIPRDGPDRVNGGRPEASPIARTAYGPSPLVKSAAPSAGRLTRRNSSVVDCRRRSIRALRARPSHDLHMISIWSPHPSCALRLAAGQPLRMIGGSGAGQGRRHDGTAPVMGTPRLGRSHWPLTPLSSALFRRRFHASTDR
jgi:hypothetical protein